MAKPPRKPKKPARSQSLEALNASSTPTTPRKAPNPLRSASPERLAAARDDVERIIAARRHGLANP